MWQAIATAAPAVLNAAGGIGGYFAGRKERDDANALSEAAYNMQMGIPNPPELASKLAALKYEALQAPDSKLAAMVEDSGVIDIQTQALKDMQVRARQGSNAEDIAASRKAQQDMNANNMAAQNSIAQQNAMRGTSGSGAALAQQIAAQQGAANMGSQAATQNAANSSERMTAALGQVGNMAQNIRQQNLASKEMTLGAADKIAMENYRNKQSTADKNVGLQRDAIQQEGTDYDRRLGRTGALIAGTRQRAEDQANKGAADAQRWSGMFSGAAQGAAAGGTYANQVQANQNQTDSNNLYRQRYGLS